MRTCIVLGMTNMYVYKPSRRLLNIVYADLFIIEGQGTLIMGHGKTATGRSAVEYLDEFEISNDFVCLSKIGNYLVGHWEPPLSDDDFVPMKPVVISQCIYYLDNNATQGMFDKAVAKQVSIEKYVHLARFDLTFRLDDTVSKKGLLSHLADTDRAEFLDQEKRVARFCQLLKESRGIRCYMVPWTADQSSKVELTKQLSRAPLGMEEAAKATS